MVFKNTPFLVPNIIFEDPFILVLEKPAGLVVNRAESVKGKTLQDWLITKVKLSKELLGTAFANRNGLVHRLDKETSGLILVAKNPSVLDFLQNQFKERQVIKRYQALVHDWINPPTGEIDTPIARNRFNRKKFGVYLGGKRAVTSYQTLTKYKSEKVKGKYFCLLELIPKTGRTHQLRVQLKYLNHPIVSDSTYAGRKTSRNDREWCPRLFLHATYIDFNHPQTKKRISFSSPLPEELSRILLRLNQIK